jgi:hypothetical protein
MRRRARHEQAHLRNRHRRLGPLRLADIDKFGERRFIRSRCPTHLSFHAWVMQLRGGDNRVQVIEYERGEMPHEQL